MKYIRRAFALRNWWRWTVRHSKRVGRPLPRSARTGRSHCRGQKFGHTAGSAVTLMVRLRPVNRDVILTTQLPIILEWSSQMSPGLIRSPDTCMSARFFKTARVNRSASRAAGWCLTALPLPYPSPIWFSVERRLTVERFY